GIEGNALDVRLMSGETADRLSRLRIPQNQRIVSTARDDQFSVRRERSRQDIFCVTLQSFEKLEIARAPKLQLPITARSQHRCAIRRIAGVERTATVHLDVPHATLERSCPHPAVGAYRDKYSGLVGKEADRAHRAVVLLRLACLDFSLHVPDVDQPLAVARQKIFQRNLRVEGERVEPLR